MKPQKTLPLGSNHQSEAIMTDPIQTAITLFANLQVLLEEGATTGQVMRYAAEAQAQLEALTGRQESPRHPQSST